MMEEGQHSLDVIANETGFGDRERMRRAFLQILGPAAALDSSRHADCDLNGNASNAARMPRRASTNEATVSGFAGRRFF
jgi:hypothetical protein